MKMHFALLVGLSGFVPIGMAVAEYADTSVAPAASADDHAEQLITLGQKMVEGVSKARTQLAAALERARSAEDVVLATCLEGKLEELTRLEGKATNELTALRGAADAGAAQVPYVVITVVGQKASLVVEEAQLCVGAEKDDPGMGVDDIAPPTDPNAELPAGPFDIVPPGTPSTPAVLPPPMGMPQTPPDASPVR